MSDKIVNVEEIEARRKNAKRDLETKIGCGDIEKSVHDDYDFLNKD
jgi:hypothetical protein